MVTTLLTRLPQVLHFGLCSNTSHCQHSLVARFSKVNYAGLFCPGLIMSIKQKFTFEYPPGLSETNCDPFAASE